MRVWKDLFIRGCLPNKSAKFPVFEYVYTVFKGNMNSFSNELSYP